MNKYEKISINQKMLQKYNRNEDAELNVVVRGRRRRQDGDVMESGRREEKAKTRRTN